MRIVLGLLRIACAVAAIGVVLVLRGAGSEPIVAPQDAMPQRLLVGLQDDPSFRWDADRATMLDGAREAGASLLRTVVVWKDTAPIRPANAIDPFDPAYRLDDVDDLVRSAQQRGMEILVTIWGTPGWANGGEAPNRPPTDPADLEDFATALADRAIPAATRATPPSDCSPRGTSPISSSSWHPSSTAPDDPSDQRCTRRSPGRSTTV
jgi:hypothetical protein